MVGQPVVAGHAIRTLDSITEELARRMLEASRAEARLVAVDLPGRLARRVAGLPMAVLADRTDFAWQRRDQEIELYGFGAALTLTGGSESDPGAAGHEVRRQRRSLTDLTASNATPRFFGGGRFRAGGSAHDPVWAGFGGWRMTLPELIVARVGGVTSASVTMAVSSDDTVPTLSQRMSRLIDRFAREYPSPSTPAGPAHAPGASQERWESAVEDAVREIGEGRYRKVVLARQLRLARSGGPSVGAVLERLAERYPSCFVFKHRVGAWSWVGASPELLVSLACGELTAASLAGTRRRSPDPETDRQLADELLADPKELEEHRFVAEALRSALDPLCLELESPDEPAVMTIANVHHLYTPFRGLAAPGTDVWVAASALHPTPAVGGAPRDAALDAIERLESIDRGWYAGPIGWMDVDGNGEFAVALRSGLIGTDEAILYAGAGIVAGSKPANEYAETELKFRPLREALDA